MTNEIMKDTLQEATKNIIEWQAIEAGATFEIGRILREIKDSDIEHGQWTTWLESVGYNPRTAQRYMQIYERFHEIPEAQNIQIGKLTELLSLPVDVDASEFIEEVKDDSVRMIREKVREVKGIKKQTEETPSEEGATRIDVAKTDSSDTVSKITVALNNIIPEMLDDIINEETATVRDILVIGRETQKVQRRANDLVDEFEEGYRLAHLSVERFIKITKITPVGKEHETIKSITEFLREFGLSINKIEYMDKLDDLLNAGDFGNFIKGLEGFTDEIKKEWEERTSSASSGGSFDWDNLFNKTESTAPNAAILGVEDAATPGEIKKRYRQLAGILHPDRGGDGKLFDLITKSYRELYEEAK